MAWRNLLTVLLLVVGLLVGVVSAGESADQHAQRMHLMSAVELQASLNAREKTTCEKKMDAWISKCVFENEANKLTEESL